MNIEDLLTSELLELYTLGLLNEDENAMVEGLIASNKEAKIAYEDIQAALMNYGYVYGKPLNEVEKGAILDYVKTNAKNHVSSGKTINSTVDQWWKVASVVLGLFAMLGLWHYFQSERNQALLVDENNRLKIYCDSISEATQNLSNRYLNLQNPNNRVLNFAATDKFDDVDIILHYNEVDRRNYIQVLNGTNLDKNSAYQLWSLKEGQDPIPLDVFIPIGSDLIPINFEPGTSTYAITIEDKKGALQPNLTMLVGTLKV